MPDILLLDDDRFLAHETGPRHLERPERLLAIRAALADRPVEGLVRRTVARPATAEELLRVHTPAHLLALEAARGTWGAFDHETPHSPGSVDAAYLAAGAAIEAVTAVVEGPLRRAFALVRPPGHHAEAELAMGFCLVNNVAVAVAHATATLGCRRVLVVDLDAHHGNGTQHAFYTRRDVLVFSVHRFPYYPGTGAFEEEGREEGRGYSFNVPLSPRSGDGDYASALRELLLPLADAFRPDLVVVSAGFDAHADDPEGGMAMTEAGYAALTGIVLEVAEKHAGGRVAFVLEGGYDPPALGRSVREALAVLAGGPVPEVAPPTPRGEAAIRRARLFHSRHWPVL